mmetsp:Transcript_9086/g.37374  ORF Transcript_9086/g.37374 Transcript_9086/m.37374 type:complete len:216 (+) Transcript_9086:1788-2435(+)
MLRDGRARELHLLRRRDRRDRRACVDRVLVPRSRAARRARARGSAALQLVHRRARDARRARGCRSRLREPLVRDLDARPRGGLLVGLRRRARQVLHRLVVPLLGGAPARRRRAPRDGPGRRGRDDLHLRGARRRRRVLGALLRRDDLRGDRRPGRRDHRRDGASPAAGRCAPAGLGAWLDRPAGLEAGRANRVESQQLMPRGARLLERSVVRNRT